MDNNIPIIYKDPMAVAQTLDSNKSDICLFEGRFDLFCYRFYLGSALAGADNKIVCYCAQAL